MSRQFPCQPVAALLRRLARQERVSMPELAQRFGLTFATVRQCLEGSYLREGTADRVACALGRHPVEVWPDWFT